MTPSEIRDQILAIREAILDPTVEIAGGGGVSDMGDWLAIKTNFRFGLKNVGSRICKNPFLRVATDRLTRSHIATFDHSMSGWKVDLTPGTIIHVDDSLHFFNLEFGACIILRQLLAPPSSPAELLGTVRIRESNSGFKSLALPDQKDVEEITFHVRFGAENAVARINSFTFDRDTVAAGIFVRLGDTIKDFVFRRGGTWRADFVDQIAQLELRQQVAN